MTTTASLFVLLFAPSGQGGPGISAFVIQIGQHKQLLASLQRGDRVVTSSGIVGEVLHIKDDVVTVRSGEAKFEIMRSGIASITNRTAVEAKPA